MSSKQSRSLSMTACRYLAVLISVLLIFQGMVTSVLGAQSNFRKLPDISQTYANSGSQASVSEEAAGTNDENDKNNTYEELDDEAAEGETIAGEGIQGEGAQYKTSEGDAAEGEISAEDPKTETFTVEAGMFASQQEQNATNEIVIKYRTVTPETAITSETANSQTAESREADENSIMSAQSAGAGEGSITLIKVNSGEDLNIKLDEIRSDPRVEYAEPNYRLYATQAPYPNDPRYSEQWQLQDKIHLYTPQAWSSALEAVTTLNNAVPVFMAVLDTGIDYNHEDLAGRIVQDGFNAIDKETGLDKVADDSSSGHGTLVSGIAAAATNNSIGIAGTAGEFPVKILPVKVLDKLGTGTMLDVAQGIEWAADNGAKVINLSLGARLPDYPRTLAEAVEYAQNKGVLVVAAGGNDGGEVEGFYPACLPGVISVGSTDNKDKKTDFSTEGCTVYAPGVNILSTLPDSAQNPSGTGRYGAITGTSASAPIVSATCALLWSVYPDKSSVTIGDSARYGRKYYGEPIYSYIFNMLKAFENVNSTHLTYDEIQLLTPEDNAYVAGEIEITVQAENSDKISKVVFYCRKAQFIYDSGSIIGTVDNAGSIQSGVYTITFNTTNYDDGAYFLKVVAYDSEDQVIASDNNYINISNELKSGLSIKVLKPDGTAGAGAKITVWHIIKDGTDVVYEPIAYRSFKADKNGILIIPGGKFTEYGEEAFASDGNDYLITARGTDPGYLYYKPVRAPANVMMDAADASKVIISGKDLNGNSMTGACIMTDRKDIDYDRLLYYESTEFNEFTHVPAAILDSEGKAEMYFTKGEYSFRMLDADRKYYLVKENVTVNSESSDEINVDFHPNSNEISTLKLAPDQSENASRAAILLRDRFGEELLGFELEDIDENIFISPGSYSACISALYADKEVQDMYWKWELEPPVFVVGAEETHQIDFGGTFEGTEEKIRVSSIGPDEVFHQNGIFTTGRDAWFKAALTDSKGNEIVGLYEVTQPETTPVSQGTLLKRAIQHGRNDSESMVESSPAADEAEATDEIKAVDMTQATNATKMVDEAEAADEIKTADAAQATDVVLVNYSYNPGSSGFEAVGETKIHPVINITKPNDKPNDPNTVLASKKMSYVIDGWGTYWKVPESDTDVQYTAKVKVEAGALGSCTSNDYEFTAIAPTSVPTGEPDLEVVVTDRKGEPMQAGKILLLHKEGNAYERVVTSYDYRDYGFKKLSSDGKCSYDNIEMIPGDDYAVALYGNSIVPGSMSDEEEPLFICQAFKATGQPMELKINTYDTGVYNLKKVNLKPTDQDNVSFSDPNSENTKTLEYWAYAITSDGTAAGMFLKSDFYAHDLSLWVSAANGNETAKYIFQATSTEQWNIDKPHYFMKKMVSMPANPLDIPETGLDVTLGGKDDLACISFGESFYGYAVGGLALFDDVLHEAVIFHPFDLTQATNNESGNEDWNANPEMKQFNDLYVSHGNYIADIAIGHSSINGNWGYWLEKDISLYAGETLELNSSDNFTLKLEIDTSEKPEPDVSEYRPEETVVFANTIEDSYKNRLVAADTGVNFTGGNQWSSLESEAEKDVGAQNHYEIAPFISVLDPEGNEVLRYKQPSTSASNLWMWNTGGYRSDDYYFIPSLIMRPDIENTYFSGSYDIPVDAAGGIYSVTLELGAGPNGIVKSKTENFTVLVSVGPTAALNQPVSPIKDQTVSISGKTTAGSIVEISYDYFADYFADELLDRPNSTGTAGTATAGNDGGFDLENASLPYEGKYVFTGIATKDNITGEKSKPVIIIVDRTIPSVPGNFKAEGQNETTIALTWETAADNDEIAGYRIAKDGIAIESLVTGVLRYTDSNLQQEVDYHYEVYAVDRAGNESQPASAIGRTLSTGDIEAPSVPSNLRVNVDGGGTAKLEWDASTDNIGVTGYKVFRAKGDEELEEVGNTDGNTLQYTDTGLFAETVYTYYLKAFDEKGNESQLSEAVMTTTPKINISGIAWRVPRKTINGLAFSGDKMTLTMSADKNRNAEAVINCLSWYDEDRNLLEQPQPFEYRISMIEDGIVKGLYRGNFVIEPGVSQMISITAVLSDGSGHTTEKPSDAMLPLDVAGKIKVNLVVPEGVVISPEEARNYLSGMSLIMTGSNNSSFATLAINNGLGLYAMDGLASAGDYVLKQVNEKGGLVCERSGIIIKNGLETEVEFNPQLPAGLNVRILDEQDGSPVSGVSVLCMITQGNTQGNKYIARGVSGDDGWVKNENKSSESGLPFAEGMQSGDEVRLNISLGKDSQDLYAKYNISSQADYRLTLNSGENSFDIELKRHNFVELQGAVTDKSGAPVEGVFVTVTQRLNYINSVEFMAVTDSNGHYSMQVLPLNATVIFSHPKAFSVSKHITDFKDPVDAQLELLGLIRLNVFTKMAGDTKERPLEIDWRVGVHFRIGVKNLTTGITTSQASMDWPFIRVKGSPGNKIQISVSGQEAGMNNQIVEVTLNEDMYAEAEVHLVENGKITARILDDFGNERRKFPRTIEAYKADVENARICSTQSSVRSDLEVKLPDGKYTLIFYWGIARQYGYGSYSGGYWNINNWSEMYREGIDFVKIENVEVNLGEIANIGDVFLPMVFSLTGDYFTEKEGNSFTPNNIEAVPGSIVTLTALYNYDETQSVHPRNVKLKLSIPDDSQLVENSLRINVTKGKENPEAEIKQGYIEVDLGNAEINENGTGILEGLKGTVTCQVKLNSNPGSSRAGARAWMSFFGKDGVTNEELGTVIINVPHVSISGPTEVGPDNTERIISVYGRAPDGSMVSIYDGYNLVGEALSTGFGVWSTTIKLINRGKPSTHFLTARITDNENDITSKVLKVTYGSNTPILSKITMFQEDGRHVTFDPSQGVASFPYVFVPGMPFTFEVSFTNNEAVDNVRVITRNGVFTNILYAEYNTAKACFIASGKLNTNNRTDPGTIFVEYTIKPLGYVPPAETPGSGQQEFVEWEQQERNALPEVWRDAEYSFDEGIPNEEIKFDADGLLRIPPITVTLKNVSRYINPGDSANTDADLNANNFTGGSGSGSNSDDIVLKVSMEIQYLENLNSTNVFGVTPLYGGMSGSNTTTNVTASMSGDTYILSFIAPMKTLCASSAAEQLIHSQDVNINIESGYGKVTVKASQIGGAYKIYDTIKSGFEFRDKLDSLNSFLEAAVGCAPNARDYYEQMAQNLADSAFTNLCVKYASTLAGIACAATGVGIVGTVAIGAVSGIGNYLAEKRWQESFKELKAELSSDDECERDDDDDDNDNDNDNDDDNDSDNSDGNGNRKKRKKAANPKYIWDPSGYVYEAVPENRLEGVTATAMYKDASTGEWKIWDAVWYLQENPLVTDPEGRYAWDVPQGEWKVVYEKPGYEIAYSDVLPVPPPQTEVNIGMISTTSPEVVSIVPTIGGRYIDITFSKYMKAHTLTVNSITVTPTEENAGAEADEGSEACTDADVDEGSEACTEAGAEAGAETGADESAEELADAGAAVGAGANAEALADTGVDTGIEALAGKLIPVDPVTDPKGVILTRTVRFTPDECLREGGVYNVFINKLIQCYGERFMKDDVLMAVTVSPFIHVENISLDRNSLALNVGETFTLTATITPSDATDKSVVWSSGKPSIADVDANGKITAKTPGTTVMTVATVDGNKIASCGITVTDPATSDPDDDTSGDGTPDNGTPDNGTPSVNIPDDNTKPAKKTPVIGLLLDKENLTLEEGGDPVQLIVTIVPDNATEIEIVWTSNDESVATVVKGLVTPLKQGVADITVSLKDGSLRKVCKVTVKPVTVLETNILETVIGEEAQYVKAFADEIVLCLESGTFPEGTPITIRKLQEDQAEKGRPGESSLRSIKFTHNGVIYEIDTGGIQPRKPLSIIIGYDSSSLGDLDPRKLGIYRQDDDDPSLWIYRGGAVNMEDDTIQTWLDSLSSYTVMAHEKTFEDIKAHWSKNYVEILASRNVINGVNNREFQPERSVTRAEMTKMLVMVLMSDLRKKVEFVSPKTPTFKDVAVDKWYYQYIETAACYGIIKGSGGMFRPDDLISREEMALMVIRMLNSEEEINSASAGNLNCSDANNVSVWAKGAVTLAEQKGILKGDGTGAFNPRKCALRGEAAAVIMRAMEQLGLVTQFEKVMGKVRISEIEGRHFELTTCIKCNLPPIYVLLPVDDIVAAKLEAAIDKKVEVEGILSDEMDIYMRGPVIKVVSVD